MNELERKLIRGLRNPPAAWLAIRARARGLFFKLWCTLFRPRISIGRGLKLEGKLKVRGPGRVTIGDNVIIGMLVTAYTHAPEAVIRIADNVFLNGTRFGCKERITVGAKSIIAECRISDCDFHSTNPDHRNDAEYIKSAPVNIEENVWIAADCFILRGVKIGRDSTVAAMSLVRSNVPSGSIVGGNPATIWKRLEDRMCLKR